MTSPSTFVATVNVAIADQLRQDLANMGFTLSTPPYTLFAAKKSGVSCTLYQSGKLTVQGKEMAPFIEFYLEPQILKSFPFSYGAGKALSDEDKEPHIGVDESGKGDFFGPLCIAAVYAGGDDIGKLIDIGVRDSKAISASKIAILASKIRSSHPHHIVRISPQKYNELMEKFHNLNRLLAWGHATAIEALAAKTGCRRVIIDKFADEEVVASALKKKQLEVDLCQRHRGEEDVVVAAASILARQAFVEGIEALEKQFGILLPKGASEKTLAAGRSFVSSHGAGALSQVCKLHFKTYDDIQRHKAF